MICKLNSALETDIGNWRTHWKDIAEYFNPDNDNVGSGQSRTFEDVLNILDIQFDYVSEDMIPQGYQFFTKSDPKNWMEGWLPDYLLDRGLNEYKNYLI